MLINGAIICAGCWAACAIRSGIDFVCVTGIGGAGGCETTGEATNCNNGAVNELSAVDRPAVKFANGVAATGEAAAAAVAVVALFEYK